MWNFVKGFGKVLSLVSAVKLWNMSLQNTYLNIWKATVYYMIFNMDSDILDPVKPNYCPLFKNLLQIQIKIFKLISQSEVIFEK
jgi:hypothetical protein